MLEKDTEIVLSARDVNFTEVAKVTRGSQYWRTPEESVVQWNGGQMTLEWRTKYNEKGEQTNEKTLFFWRGDWGGSGMEACGLVLGKNYAAFVYPGTDNDLVGELISEAEVKKLSGPVHTFSQAFAKAREIASRVQAE